MTDEVYAEQSRKSVAKSLIEEFRRNIYSDSYLGAFLSVEAMEWLYVRIQTGGPCDLYAAYAQAIQEYKALTGRVSELELKLEDEYRAIEAWRQSQAVAANEAAENYRALVEAAEVQAILQDKALYMARQERLQEMQWKLSAQQRVQDLERQLDRAKARILDGLDERQELLNSLGAAEKRVAGYEGRGKGNGAEGD